MSGRNTDGANWYDQLKKYHWEDPMEYARLSPLTYVGDVNVRADCRSRRNLFRRRHTERGG